MRLRTVASVAAEKFSAFFDTCSSRAIASELGCSHAAVLHWCHGRRVPDYHSRVKLLVAYGIPLEEWDILAPHPPTKAG